MENDFVIVLNDLQIDCNKKYVSTNFPELWRNSNTSNNQITIQIDEGKDFYEVTKDIFQGNNYEITNDNFYYLIQLSQKINSANLQTKLNSFEYKHECDNKQINQHPTIQFLVEVSTLIRQLSISNYEDSSFLLKQKLSLSIENAKKSNSNTQSSDSEKNNEGSENDEDNSEHESENDESEDEDEKEDSLSLEKIGSKELNKLFYFEIVNTLSTGFNSIEYLHEKQKKINLIIQLIKGLDEENQKNLKSKSTSFFFDNFINYVIKKYTKIKNQRSSLINYRQETQYLIHILLSNKLITLSQIFQKDSSVMIYFLEFFEEPQIKDFFSNHEQLIEFLKNEMKESNVRLKLKPKPRGKKKNANKDEENNDNLFIKLLSANIKNGLIQENELISIFLNDDVDKFKETFNNDSIDSYKLPKEISDISCSSALDNSSLIELSAFFGSENIFNYLNSKRLNHEIKDTPNLPYYVIIGQHSQIIKTFINNLNSDNKQLIFSMLSFCNDHHFNDTYDMIINSINNCPKPTYKEIDQYAKRCISRSYFDMIPFLLKEGATKNVLLNLFCRTGNETGVEYMLEFSHIDVNAPYKNLTPLEYCIQNKNAHACVLLLKNDYINIQSIDSKSTTGETILHISCHLGMAKTVSYLLRKHLYDVNLPTQDGVCPIHFAAWSGDYDTVLAVIRTKKAHIRTKVKNGNYKKRTALHFACISGNSNIITLLLDSDEKFRVDDPDCDEKTPIIYAIEGDFVDCVFVLLEQEDIDINQEYKGNNLLQYACIQNKNNVFDILLNSIVFDQNQTCKDGRTILVVAIENRNLHILRSILNKFGRSVNINIETKDGKTPLIKACEMGEIEMVKLILDHELINVNKPTSDGFTPFMAAARSGNSELLKLLLDNDEIDIYAKNKQGMTAIHYAFFSEHIEAVKFLLPLFNDKLNDITAKGETLFQIAYKKDKVQLTKLLIDNPDVDVNVRDNTGMTAFLTGAELGNLDLIKALIECGKCDLNQKTYDGRNAFLVAIQKQNYDVVKFFINLYSEYNQIPKSKGKNKSKKQAQNENNYVDITEKTNDDKTPLFIALKARNKQILLELINCPFIDINETSKDRTFLCKLVKKMCNNNNNGFGGSIFLYNQIFDAVLNREDIDVNLRSKKYNNQNILHLVCKSPNHNMKLFNKILEIKGIDINAESQEGTPLYLLIKYQNEYFKEKPKVVQSPRFASYYTPTNTYRPQTTLNKMVDILKSKTEYSESESEEEYNKNSTQSSKYPTASPNKTTSFGTPSFTFSPKTNQTTTTTTPSSTFSPKTNQTTTTTTTVTTSDVVNYWFNFLDLPKLNLNKGGNPDISDHVFRNRNYYYYNNFNNNYNYNNDNENVNKNIETPLELAVKMNYSEIAKALVSMKGVNINTSNNSTKRTPLLLAIYNSNVDLIEKILERKDAKVNVQDAYGNTPLLLAIRQNSPKMTNFILTFMERQDVVKTINTPNNDGTTPFLASVMNPYTRIFDNFLTFRGVDLSHQDKSGNTALYILINNVNYSIIKDVFDRVKSLNEQCPSLLNVVNNNYRSPLFSSIINYTRNDKDLYNIISYFLDQDDVDLSLPEDFYPDEEEEEKNETKEENENTTSSRKKKSVKSDDDEKNEKPNSRRRKSTKKDDEDEDEEESNKKSTSRRRKSTKKDEDEDEEESNKKSTSKRRKSTKKDDDDEDEEEGNKKSTSRRRKSTKKDDDDDSNKKSTSRKRKSTKKDDDDDDEESSKKSTSRKRKSAKKDEENEDEEESSKKSTSRKKKSTKKIVERPKYTGIRYTSLLHIACSKKIPDIVAKLIPLMISFYERKGSRVSLFTHKNTKGDTVLNVACLENDIDTIGAIIDYIKNPDNNINYNDPEEFDINTISSSNLAPLHVVSSIEETIKSLHVLENILTIDSIDINLISQPRKRTALHFACSNENEKVVCKMIDFCNVDIDPNILDINQMTPLLIAVSQEQPSIVGKLLELSTIDVNLSNPKERKTPLYIACEKNNSEIATILLNDERTDPNIPLPNTGKAPLYVACEVNNADIVSLLLNDEKTNPNCQVTRSLKTPLIHVVENNKEELLEIILKHPKIDLNIIDNESNTALHYACSNNNKKMVENLIGYSPELIDPNIFNSSKKTPLIIAVTQNNSPVVKRLLSIQSLDVNLSIPEINKSPLFITFEQWNFKLASRLLNDERIDPNCQIMPSGKTPLMYSIEEYKSDLFNIIIDNLKIDLDVVDSEKLTAFHYACKIGQIKFIRDIYHKKCSLGGMSLHDYLNLQANNGFTPLHYACSSNNKEAIMFFLEMNISESNTIDINIRDKKGLTPFDVYISNPSGLVDNEVYDTFLSESNKDKIETKADYQDICDKGHYKVVDFMLSKLKFDPNNKENKDQMTLLHILCQNQKIDLIKELLSREEEFNVDINAIDIKKMTPLHHAVISSYDNSIVSLLLSTNKCDINAKDNKGRTALHYACELGKTTIIEELLNYKDVIDINAQDFTGSSLLHDLAKSVHFDVNVLRLVLNSECVSPINPNLKDNLGNTPLHIACSRENILFVSNLIQLSPIEIDINSLNNKFETPFYITCKNNDFIMYETLLSSKLGDKIDINLASPLFVTAIKGHLFLFERMLEIPGIDLHSNIKENNLKSHSEDGKEYVKEYKFNELNLLHIVSSYDSPELLTRIIQTGEFNVNEPTGKNVPNKLNGTPLIIALKNNRLKNLYVLFECFGSGLDLSIYDLNGKAAVHYCFELGSNSMNILQELIKIDDKIINMETNDSSRSTPLMIAFQQNEIDSALLLLQQPSIDVFCINKNQNSIAHLVATQTRKDIVDFVLTKIKSSTSDIQDIVDFINIDNSNGETALLIACKKCSIYVVRSLIDIFKDSLDFTISDNNGISPFIAAVESKNNELIHLLLTNVNCTNTVDLSVPINEDDDYIAQLMVKNSNLDNFKLLIEETSSHSSNLNVDFINVKNKKGESLISITIQNGKYDIFNYICETQNPDLNVSIKGKMPLLFEAADFYDFELFKSIIDYGSFNINQKFNGMSILHYTVQSHNDSYEKVSFLIHQEGIDVNCTTDKGGITPLHMAVKDRNESIIRLLLSLNDKIDVNKQNSRHKSPRDMARNRRLRRLFDEYDSRIKEIENKEKEKEEEEEEDKNDNN